MIVGRWYVQLAAVWHFYLPLCIYIFLFYIVSVHSFFFFSFFFFFFFYFFFLLLLLYPGIDKLDGIVDDTSMS